MEKSAAVNRSADKKSIRIFKSDFCERLSHIHPITPLLFWTPVVLYLFWRSAYVSELSFSIIAILAFSGLFLWTLTEYLLHRFIFHFRATGRHGKLLMFFMHGIHHSTPQDKTRLVMPIPMAIVLSIILFSIFRGIFGAVYVEPFFAAFLIGYLIYDYSHYAIHHFRPRTRFGKMLKQHHMDHHFVDHDSKFGVSSPFWDYVFKTKNVEKHAQVPQFVVMTEREIVKFNDRFVEEPFTVRFMREEGEPRSNMETLA